MKGLRFLPVAIVALVLAALVWRLVNPPDTVIESELVGQSAPQFPASAAVAGEPALARSDLSDGRAKLVNFFASWCVPCIAEAPVLEELEGLGVPIVGIAVRDRPEDVARFLARHGNPYEKIGADPTSQVQLAFGSAGVPETFVVDGKGTIVRQHVGPIERGDVPELVESLRSAR